MRNRVHLKDLNDSKLIVNESKWFTRSSMINYIPFRIFRGPLFHKPVTDQKLFFAFFLQQTGSNLVAGVWTIRWYVLIVFNLNAGQLPIWKESESLFMLIMLLAKPKYRGFYLYIQWAHLLHCKQTAYTTILSFQISFIIRISVLS